MEHGIPPNLRYCEVNINKSMPVYSVVLYRLESKQAGTPGHQNADLKVSKVNLTNFFNGVPAKQRCY